MPLSLSYAVIAYSLCTINNYHSWADPEIKKRGPDGERGARAYNGGLGRSPQRSPKAQGVTGEAF